MIKTNLAVLMAERGLKIADVYEATGISKTTLMAISENTGKGIQYETMDKLCNYFGITPKDFFIYSPYRFSVSWVDLGLINDQILEKPKIKGDTASYDLTNLLISLEKEGDVLTYPFNLVVVPKNDNHIPITIQNNVDFGILLGNWPFTSDGVGDDNLINIFISKLSPLLLNDVKEQINNKIIENIALNAIAQNGIPYPSDSNNKMVSYKAISEGCKFYISYEYDGDQLLKNSVVNLTGEKINSFFKM